MKKFFLMMFCAALTLSSLSSCKDDDDNNVLANTTWEYKDIFTDGTVVYTLRFNSDMSAYYEMAIYNAGGTLLSNDSSPYIYQYSGSLVIMTAQQAGKANLEATITDGIKLILTNTSNNVVIGTFYKK